MKKKMGLPEKGGKTGRPETIKNLNLGVIALVNLLLLSIVKTPIL